MSLRYLHRSVYWNLMELKVEVVSLLVQECLRDLLRSLSVVFRRRG
jgi:hypothetical protein